MKNNQSLFEIELTPKEQLSYKHIGLMLFTIKEFKTTFINSSPGFDNKSSFVDQYVSYLKRRILELTNLETDDRNILIKILDKFLTHNALIIYQGNCSI